MSLLKLVYDQPEFIAVVNQRNNLEKHFDKRLMLATLVTLWVVATVNNGALDKFLQEVIGVTTVALLVRLQEKRLSKGVIYSSRLH